MSKVARKPVGRPRASELLVKLPPFHVSPKVAQFVEDEVKKHGTDTSKWGRDVLEQYLSGQLVHVANVGVDDTSLKFLTKAPAGPWQGALEHASHFTLSKNIAEELEVQPGDVVVRVMGESMDGAGVFDGALLVMRPLGEHKVPRRHEIALVQIVTADGDYQSTIKHWAGGDPVKLTDGDGNIHALPGDVREVRAVAVARGIIGRL